MFFGVKNHMAPFLVSSFEQLVSKNDKYEVWFTSYLCYSFLFSGYLVIMIYHMVVMMTASRGGRPFARFHTGQERQ